MARELVVCVRCGTHLPEACSCSKKAGLVEQVICAAPGRSGRHSLSVRGAQLALRGLERRGVVRCPECMSEVRSDACASEMARVQCMHIHFSISSLFLNEHE